MSGPRGSSSLALALAASFAAPSAAGCLTPPDAPPTQGSPDAGAVPDDCDPQGQLIAIQDEFESGVLTWGEYHRDDAGGTIGLDGRLTLTPENEIGYGYVRSTSAFDVSSATVLIEVVEMTPPAPTSLAAWFGFHRDEDSSLVFYQEDGVLQVGGEQVQYDAVLHRYLRIRAGDCGVLFEASPDGSIWNRLGGAPPPPRRDSMFLEIGVGNFRAESGPLGRYVLDNLNVLP